MPAIIGIANNPPKPIYCPPKRETVIIEDQLNKENVRGASPVRSTNQNRITKAKSDTAVDAIAAAKEPFAISKTEFQNSIMSILPNA